MVNSKHLATFILGAAAGVALHKYFQTEEGEKVLEELKAKAGEFKAEAETAMDKAPEYFEQLKDKGTAALKERFPEAEQMLQDLINSVSGVSKPIDVHP
jgi:hypothetical protein